MKPETAIQINIVATLSALAEKNGFAYFAVPNEGFMAGASGKGYLSKADHARLSLLKQMGLTPGASDLVILSRGRAFCLEIKSEDGELSDNQRLFAAWCLRVGVPYCIARSVKEAIQHLRAWGVIE